MVSVDEKILLGSIIAGGSALFFIVLYLINRFRKRRELKQQLKLRNASRAPLSSMRSQRSDRGNARRHIVSRGLQLDQLSGSARDAYQQRQQRRVAQYSDLQLVMDEIFIPERDAVETEPEEEETPDDRSTWIAENEDISTHMPILLLKRKLELEFLSVFPKTKIVNSWSVSLEKVVSQEWSKSV